MATSAEMQSAITIAINTSMTAMADVMMTKMGEMTTNLNGQFQLQRIQDQAAPKMLIESNKRPENTGLGDMKHLQNLPVYTGIRTEFYEWARKVRCFIGMKSTDIQALVKDAKIAKVIPIMPEHIMEQKGEDGVKHDKSLHAYLLGHTGGEAAAIMAPSQGCGCEAWRLLCNRFDPKTAETKRALMKQITIPMVSKSHKELDGHILQWEQLIRRYEEATGKGMDTEHKVCTLIEMCPERLREWLTLNVKEDQDYEEIRKLIVRQVDLHRD